MVLTIVGMIIIGLIAGAIARLLVPGRQDLSIVGTIAVGFVGSLVGGFLGYVLFKKDAGSGALQPSGLIGSVIGAVVVLLVWQAFQRRSISR